MVNAVPDYAHSPRREQHHREARLRLRYGSPDSGCDLQHLSGCDCSAALPRQCGYATDAPFQHEVVVSEGVSGVMSTSSIVICIMYLDQPMDEPIVILATQSPASKPPGR